MFNRHIHLVGELSYLIDKGRLYLLNITENTHGTEKPGAYRGLRLAALNRVVRFHDKAKLLNFAEMVPNKTLQKELTNIKREFVSEGNWRLRFARWKRNLRN